MWADFLEQWWGNARAFDTAEPPLVLTIQDKEMWGTLVPLAYSSGQLLVRREYELMYDRMVKGAQIRVMPIPGVIITGHPGIGEPPPHVVFQPAP